jgi:hypothetical protein
MSPARKHLLAVSISTFELPNRQFQHEVGDPNARNGSDDLRDDVAGGYQGHSHRNANATLTAGLE